MNTAPLKEGASVTLWLTYQLLYLLSVDQDSIGRESVNILAEWSFTVGRVSVDRSTISQSQ